jgi:hypothetical protein
MDYVITPMKKKTVRCEFSRSIVDYRGNAATTQQVFFDAKTATNHAT